MGKNEKKELLDDLKNIYMWLDGGTNSKGFPITKFKISADLLTRYGHVPKTYLEDRPVDENGAITVNIARLYGVGSSQLNGEIIKLFNNYALTAHNLVIKNKGKTITELNEIVKVFREANLPKVNVEHHIGTLVDPDNNLENVSNELSKILSNMWDTLYTHLEEERIKREEYQAKKQTEANNLLNEFMKK